MSTTAESVSSTEVDAGAGAKLGGDAPPVRRSWSVAPLLLRLHFYAGILVAPFLVVAAITGLAFVFTPQLDAAVYSHEFFVDPVGQSTPLAQQVAAAVAAHPEGSVGSVIVSGEADTTTRVVFNVESLGEKQDTVFVDPYTSEVRGSLVTWFGETPLQTWFDDLHRNLHLGVFGRHYSELAASWLWVVVLGGLVLWLRRQRGRRRVRATLLPDLSAGKGVRRTRSWHAATGVWLAIGLLILSATGLTWSRYAGANFGAALDAFNGHAPDLTTAVEAAPPSGHHGTPGEAAQVDIAAPDIAAVDGIVATARSAGLAGPIQVDLPAGAGAAWAVSQDDPLWPVSYDAVAVDAAGLTVTDRVDYAGWPILAKLTKLGISAHMGRLFGLVNQLLLAALALGLLCVIFWGYRMWWQRRPTRADRARLVGKSPTRGGWIQLPAWAIVIGVPLALAIGWALPELGVSLLAFLAVDLIVGAVKRRRQPPVVPTSPAPAGS